MTSRSDGAVPALVLLAAIWGYNWVVMKIGLGYAGPFTFGALRVAGGAAFLALALVAMRRSLRLTAPVPVAILGVLQTTAFVAFSSLAISSGGAGKSAVLMYTMPFWALLLAWPFLGERPHGWQRFGVVAGFVGLLCVLYPLDFGRARTSEAYALAGGLCWGASVVYAKWVRARFELELGALTLWQMIFGALPLIAFAWLAREPAPHWVPAFDVSLVYNILLGTALGWLLWLYVVDKLPAGIAGVASLASPVIGVLAAWLQLHEVPRTSEVVGLLCIVTALAALVVQGRLDALRPRPVLVVARDA